MTTAELPRALDQVADVGHPAIVSFDLMTLDPDAVPTAEQICACRGYRRGSRE
jgi:hypothetical protein